MFQTVKNPPDFPSLDKDILEFWEKNRIFQRTIEEREGREDFVFYDGPPGTNGLPHVGHIMQSALKDLWPRFWTMRGKRVLRKAGWDTHGLPVELTSDRELGLESKQEIEEYGIQKYIDHCRNTVFRFKGEWEQVIRRVGRFLDMDDFYATYKTSFIQSDWWILKQAWDTKVKPEFVKPNNLFGKNRFLYKDYRISAWCPRQGTTLSNFEVAQGYKEVTENALFAKFKVKNLEETYLVAWTTTAWTLLSNIAIAVGPDIDYVKIRLNEDVKGGRKDENLIIARSRLAAMEGFLGTYEIVGSMKGVELEGLNYEPLWKWQVLDEGTGHYVIPDSYVTTEDGSGMVHLAPYGEDDYRIMNKNNLPVRLVVNEHGYVSPIAEELSGHWFKDDELEIKIIRDLASRNLLLAKEKHEHTYPFHYKTGSPLMYFPRPGWFIRATAMRDEMIVANQQINWYPSRIRDGRFGKWLEGVIDWNITRERFWGSPLPVWSSEDGEEAVCVGSISELNEWIKKSGGEPLAEDADLHKPGIDNIVLRGESGRELRRENFVLDSWYNAGIMPWGQIGYPASEGSVEYFNNQYPADFICEGLDQTRGWFYSMLACSTLIAIATGDKDKSRWSSYKNVICTDLVLDMNGEKMAKSRGNVVPPIPMMEKYGADAVRWSFYKNNPWLPVRFGEEGLLESLRQVFLPLWNAYSFFVTYASVDGWSPDSVQDMSKPTSLDQWILACYYDMLVSVTEHLESYDVMPAAVSINDFIDRLTNWYIRRSRRRFWKSEEAEDKCRAYHTLYTVLTGITRVMAPFAPFITEEIYQNLVRHVSSSAKDSVHLDTWPVAEQNWKNDSLKSTMDLVRNIVSLSLAARNDARLKVRQPLSTLYIVADQKQQKQIESLEELILDELNIKKIEFVESQSDLVSYSAKANFKTLGPRFGKEMKNWAQKIAGASADITVQWANAETVVLDGEEIHADDVILEQIVPDHYQVKTESGSTVALDKRLDDALLDEGYARELINKIQNGRKNRDFSVTQRIHVAIKCDERLMDAFTKNKSLIQHEVLAVSMEMEKLDNSAKDLVKINDRTVWFDLKPVD